ncbi:hypothetical protein [Wolbachia endosymbiont (group A) of Longitarsus flavicornis]
MTVLQIFKVSSQCLTTWIQEKEWCHESSLLLLSSQCSYNVIQVA